MAGLEGESNISGFANAVVVDEFNACIFIGELKSFDGGLVGNPAAFKTANSIRADARFVGGQFECPVEGGARHA